MDPSLQGDRLLYTNSVVLRASRVLTGALNGMIANSKTMISEVCGKEHEVVGMSFVTGDVRVTTELHATSTCM